MSAILSADDLNDFISPGVACIKPVETLPLQKPQDVEYAYEVTTEDAISKENHPRAQISLTDCLACSGCVTSAEAVLISLQSHSEALNALDSHPSFFSTKSHGSSTSCGSLCNGKTSVCGDSRVFVVSVSPQVRASLAATYGVSERRAGWMMEQLLNGPQGLPSGGKYGNGFTWVVDTNAMREAALVVGADEVINSLPTPCTTIPAHEQEPSSPAPQKPILTSACPGWICYAEKTHPHILPHLSRLKSPQALTGTLLKTVLSQRLNITPDRIWHMAIMPCFDKKLEASRGELTDTAWHSTSSTPIRDVDCVITARELLMLADSRGISFPSLPQRPLPRSTRIPFPEPKLASFLFPRSKRTSQAPEAGTSGGYLQHILLTHQRMNPGSQILTARGRNADVIEYSIIPASSNDPILKAARYYGFRNIQNLVRKLKPPKQSRLSGARGLKPCPGAGKGMEYAYVEVMACPGGCTNGGGQIKGEDVGAAGGKEWLGRVDEAYFSADSDSISSDEGDTDAQLSDHNSTQSTEQYGDEINGISPTHIREILQHWSSSTGIELERLLYTMYRKVDSEVGKEKGGGVDRVVELASKIGGGW